jgi:AcrR family transcriptional regulator
MRVSGMGASTTGVVLSMSYSCAMAPGQPAKRPGGRTAAVSNAIRAAVEELVAEKGSERVTIPMVAERAGVNPTTVYRRWPDAATMINDLATYRLDADRPLPDTGDLRSDIAGWASEILTHYRKPINAAILRGGAAVAGDDESDCLRGRLAEAAILVQRAGRTAAVSAQDVIDHVLAPIMYRVIFLPSTLTDDYAQRLTDNLFAQVPTAVPSKRRAPREKPAANRVTARNRK